MRQAAVYLLVALAAGLAFAIGLELRADSLDEGAMSARNLATPRQDGVSAGLGAGGDGPAVADRHRREWVEAVLARPLFSPDRRPAARGAVATGAAPARLPRLSGILLDGARRSVIFAAGDGGRPVVVAEGGELNGFRVQSIEAGQVTIVGPDGPHVVRPSFDPRPAGGATPGLPVSPGGIPGLPTIGAGAGAGIPGFASPANAR